jgi:hypothetical protein
MSSKSDRSNFNDRVSERKMMLTERKQPSDDAVSAKDHDQEVQRTIVANIH